MKGNHPGSSVLLLILSLACNTSELQNQDDSHVANAQELVAEEELRIGSVNDPDSGFSRIGGVAVDAEGLIYVLESQDRQIRVYDEQGRLLRRIGSQGAGPGEFRSPVLIGLRHDTLAIGDLSLNRVTLFRGTGELIETSQVPPLWLQPAPGVHIMVAPTRFAQDGFAGSVVRMMMPPDPPRDSFWVPHVALNRTGEITDTLRFERWYLFEPQIRSGNLTVRVPSGPSSAPIYMDGHEHTYVVDRPVAAAGDPAEFTVTRVAVTGDTVYRQQFGYQPVTFGSADVDSIVATAVRPHLRNQEADSAAIAAAVRQALVLPAYKPPVVQGHVGADDVVWLRLSDGGARQHRWVLIDPEGRLQGAVSLPREATLHWSSGDHAWAVLRDELDVPWLIRYRVRDSTGSER